MKEIDCSYTDEVVCPYCGYEFSNSYEFFRDDRMGDWVEGIECEKCEKEFNVGADYSVTYSSYIPKEKENS